MPKQIARPDVKNIKELEAAAREISRDNPGKIVTYFVTFGEARFQVHDRKPRSSTWGEQTYRDFGGFFKDGEIVRPLKSWIRQFNFCPVSR